jgi:hypothetical protein
MAVVADYDFIAKYEGLNEPSYGPEFQINGNFVMTLTAETVPSVLGFSADNWASIALLVRYDPSLGDQWYVRFGNDRVLSGDGSPKTLTVIADNVAVTGKIIIDVEGIQTIEDARQVQFSPHVAFPFAMTSTNTIDSPYTSDTDVIHCYAESDLTEPWIPPAEDRPPWAPPPVPVGTSWIANFAMINYSILSDFINWVGNYLIVQYAMAYNIKSWVGNYLIMEYAITSDIQGLVGNYLMLNYNINLLDPVISFLEINYDIILYQPVVKCEKPVQYFRDARSGLILENIGG